MITFLSIVPIDFSELKPYVERLDIMNFVAVNFKIHQVWSPGGVLTVCNTMKQLTRKTTGLLVKMHKSKIVISLPIILLKISIKKGAKTELSGLELFIN